MYTLGIYLLLLGIAGMLGALSAYFCGAMDGDDAGGFFCLFAIAGAAGAALL